MFWANNLTHRYISTYQKVSEQEGLKTSAAILVVLRCFA
jgi:hypothetical protein